MGSGPASGAGICTPSCGPLPLECKCIRGRIARLSRLPLVSGCSDCRRGAGVAAGEAAGELWGACWECSSGDWLLPSCLITTVRDVWRFADSTVMVSWSALSIDGARPCPRPLVMRDWNTRPLRRDSLLLVVRADGRLELEHHTGRPFLFQTFVIFFYLHVSLEFLVLSLVKRCCK